MVRRQSSAATQSSNGGRHAGIAGPSRLQQAPMSASVRSNWEVVARKSLVKYNKPSLAARLRHRIRALRLRTKRPRDSLILMISQARADSRRGSDDIQGGEIQQEVPKMPRRSELFEPRSHRGSLDTEGSLRLDVAVGSATLFRPDNGNPARRWDSKYGSFALY